MVDLLVFEDTEQPLILLEGSSDVFVFDEGSSLFLDAEINGSFLLIDIPAPVSVVVAPPAGFILIDEERETTMISDTTGNDLVIVQSGGPRGFPGEQGIPGAGPDDAIAAHIASALPHPVYDEIPSLVLLFENGII